MQKGRSQTRHTSFLPVSLNDYVCIAQSKNVLEVTSVSGDILPLINFSTANTREDPLSYGEITLGPWFAFMLHIKSWGNSR